MTASRSLVAVAVGLGLMTAWSSPAHAASRAAGAYRLTATNTGPRYAPTFTGNGLIGVRVPASGQGYVGGSVPAQSELAGFYAQPLGDVQQRATIPTWSTLRLSDGTETFDAGAGTSNWRQSIDLRTGVVTTRALWSSAGGHVMRLTYQVLTDRARPQVGLVRLRVTPRFTGRLRVTDVIDGTPATLSTQVAKGWESPGGDWVTVRAVGTGIDATIASRATVGGPVQASWRPVDRNRDQSVGQEVSFPVRAGSTYTVTKYVGVAGSGNAAHTRRVARRQAASAAGAGWPALMHENRAAWARLWRGRIDVLGDRALATAVNASQFYLWSSTRAGVDWSVSPAGLSSNGYDGHIFWDAETWMFPSLLAQHPDIAAGMDAYRFQRLGAARRHASATGYRGARFPWESALDGTEQIPPPVSVNSEGLYEQHITADIALAQWQYYLATGDAGWLARRGWPVISGAARFWADRATRAADGSYHIRGVTGPDEENPDVNDEAYTNVAARTVIEDAVRAAAVLGVDAPKRWSRVAHGLQAPFDARLGIHPEFRGYQGQLVKQADVTLLQYPWQDQMPSRVAQHDLDYYVPRTDPLGPSMSDAVNSIDTSALGSPGCASFVYTERSYQPFIRDIFDQFSETSTGGAFTFMTGIGGFLQEFLYGYSGIRWEPHAIRLDPALTAQLGGVVLHQLRWHGRVFTVSIGARSTTLTLLHGRAMPVRTASGLQVAAAGSPVVVPTRRPDLRPTADVARCDDAVGSSFRPGAPSLAAVDGSPATGWQPVSLPATLTVPLRGAGTIDRAALHWGRLWPPAPAPNVPPPPGPVKVLRPSSYTVAVSVNGSDWRTVARVNGGHEVTDVLRFAPVHARYLRVRLATSSTSEAPILDEVRVR